MSIAPQLRQFLDEAKADYEVIDHRPTLSALDSARSANIRPECVAKAVLLDTATTIICSPSCRPTARSS